MVKTFQITCDSFITEFEGDETLLVGASLAEQEENLQKFYDRYAKYVLAAIARFAETA